MYSSFFFIHPLYFPIKNIDLRVFSFYKKMKGVKIMAKKYSARRQKVKTAWLKNALKSVGTTSLSTFKELSPNTYEMASSLGQGIGNIAYAVSSGSSRAGDAAGAIANNKYVKFAKTAYKNAMSDIRSGTFDNQERQMEAMMSMGDDYDDDSGFTLGDEGEESSIHVNVNNNRTSAAVMTVNQSINKYAETQVKTQKASMDAMIAVNAAAMQQTASIGRDVVNQLTSINSGIAQLVQFQQENMSAFIQASIGFYDHMGMKEKEEDNYNEGKMHGSDVFNNGRGGINISRYKDYVKQNIKDAFDKSDAGFVNAMLSDDMLAMAAANPLGFMSSSLVKYMMPKVMKTSIQTMESTFSNFLPEMLSRLSDWASTEVGGFEGKVRTMVGQIFGIKGGRSKTFNDAGGVNIERGAIPFDGETKHAITEVITKELRDQTGYLQIIASHYDKNAKNTARENGEYWDWNKKKYVKKRELDDTIGREIVDSIVGAMNDTRFGESMQGLVSSADNKQTQEILNEAVEELFTQIERSDKNIGIGELLEIINKLGVHKDTKRIIRRYVQSMYVKDTNAFNSINIGRLKAQSEAENAMQNILGNSTSYNLINSSFADGTVDVDDIIDQTMKYGAYGKGKKGTGVKRVKADAGLLSDNQGLETLATGFATNISSFMTGLMRGDSAETIIRNMGSNIGDQAKIIGREISNKLFGTKDAKGKRGDDGIFSDFTSGIRSIKNQVLYAINGKGYDAEHPDTADCVLGNFRKIGQTAKDGIMDRLFGKRRNKNGKYVKDDESEGLFGKVKSDIGDAINNWTDALFGTKNDEEREKTKTNIIKNLKDALPNTLTGAGIGFGVGALGGSTLGALVGGPIGAAAMGAATGFLTKNEKFMSWLFGDKDEDGKRTGGFISKKTQDYLKENKLTIAGGASVGAITGAITGGGVLGSLVGGPIAGAILGTASNLVRKSDMFQRFLYGDEQRGQKGIFKAVKDAFTDSSKLYRSDKELNNSGFNLGMAGLGAGTGALTAAILGKMGIIGSALTPAGPIGGAVLALGLSIKAQSGTFREWLFGKKDGLDIKGHKEKKQGLVGQIGNMLKANLLNPMKTETVLFIKTMRNEIEHSVLVPFSFAAEMFASGAGKVIGKLNKVATNTLNSAGDLVKETANAVFEPIIRRTGDVLEEGAQIFRKTAQTLISLPGNLFALFMKHFKIKEFIKEKTQPIADWIHQLGKDIRSSIFGGLRKIFKIGLTTVKNVAAAATWLPRKLLGAAGAGIRTLGGKVKDKLGDRYSEYSFGDQEDGIFARFKRARHDAKVDTESLRKESKELKRRNKNAKWIAKYTNGQFADDTDAAREYLKMVNPRAYQKLITGKSLGAGWSDTKNNTSRTQEKEAAEIKKNGRSTAGLSEKQLSKADPTKLNEEAKQTYFLQGIFNVVRGKRWDGKEKDSDDKDETYSERKARLLKEKEKMKKEREAAQKEKEQSESEEGVDEGGVDEGGNPFTNYIRTSIGDLQEFWTGKRTVGKGKNKSKVKVGKNALSRAVGLFTDNREGHSFLAPWKRRIHNLFEDDTIRDIPRHAKGGILEKGLAIVGEEGPEIIESRGGDEVYPTKIAKGALKKMAKGKLAKALDKAKTADESREEAKEKAKEAKTDLLIKTAKEGVNAQKEQHRDWLSMFGKKGLIFGAAAVAFLWAKKKIPALVNNLENLIKKAADFLSSGVTNLFDQLKDVIAGRKTNTDGNTTQEQAAKNIQDIKDGNILTDRTGESTGQTEAREKFLARQGMNFTFRNSKLLTDGKWGRRNKFVYRVGAKIGEGGVAVTKGIGKGAKKVGSKAASIAKNTKIGTKVATKAAERSAAKAEKKAAKTAAKEAANSAIKMAKNKVASKGVAAAGDSLFKKVSGYVMKFFDFITDKLKDKLGGKVSAKIFGKYGPKNIIEILGKRWEKIAGKLGIKMAEGTGAAAVTAGLSEVAFATIGAINGVSGTAKLFHVDGDKVDGTMRVVSGIIGAITGTTFGSVMDLIFSFLYDITQVDILSTIATAMYNALVGKKSDKSSKLKDAQTAFTDRYNDEKDATLQKQLETQQKAGIISKDVTLEDFKAGIADGTYSASFDSFSDWNAKKNKSIGDKITSGIGKTWKGTVFNTKKLFGKTKSFTDSSGNTYTENKDGTYQVKSANGDDLGFISKNALPTNTNKNKNAGLIKDIFSTTNSLISKTKTSAKNYTKKIKDQVKNFLSGKSDTIDFKLDDNDPLKPTLTMATSVMKNMLAPLNIFSNISKVVGKFTGDNSSSSNSKSSGTGGILSKIKNFIFKNKDNEGGNGGGRGEKLNGHSYFSQNDPRWSKTSYSDGVDNATYKDSGCGPAAMAMVVNDMKGKEANPVTMGNLAQATGDRDSTGTNWNFVNKASSLYGISSSQTYSPSAADIDASLSSGNPVLLSGRSSGTGNDPYTPTGHYVVAVGKDSNGNVIVNDPRGSRYSRKYKLSDIAKHTGSSWTFGGNGKKKQKKGTSDAIGTTEGRQLEGAGTDYQKWIGIIKATKKAIAAQHPGYSQSNWINITVGGKEIKMRTDCSGFCTACMIFYGVIPDNSSFWTGSYLPNNGAFSSAISNSGFKGRKWSGWDDLTEGDIIVNTSHMEIFAKNEGGQHYVYNCGSNDSTNNPNATISGHSGYDYVWSPGPAGKNCVDGIADLSANGSTSGSSSSDATADGSSSGQSKLDKLTSGISNFFSAFSSRALTGDFSNTNYDDVFNGTDSSGSSDDSSDAVSEGNSTARKGETITLPDGKGTKNSFMGWQCITSPTSTQYKLREKAGQKFDNNGYGKIKGRYTVATTTTYGNVGDYIDVKRADGSTLKAIIADIKNQNDAGCNKWGHLNGDCVTEFVVDKNKWYGNNAHDGAKIMNSTSPGNNSSAVTSITNQGSFFDGGGGFGKGTKTSKAKSYNARSNGSNINSLGRTSKVKLKQASKAEKYITTNSGSSSSELLFNAIQLLAVIADNTQSASTKLNALQNLDKLSGNTNNFISTGGNGGNKIITTSSSNGSKSKKSKNDETAWKIAQGGF